MRQRGPCMLSHGLVHRAHGWFRSVISKRWIPAVQCMSSRGDPKRVEKDMAVLVNVLLHHLHEISTTSPSCARCAPTDSNLVQYGLPTAWGAPACLHAAACADHNRATQSTQLADHSARAPQLLGSGAYMAMDQCQSLEGGPQGGAGPGAASPKVVRMASLAMRPRTHSAPVPALSLGCRVAMDVLNNRATGFRSIG
jgi:hypothetical protein